MYCYRLHSYQYFIQKNFLLWCTHYQIFDDLCRVETYGLPGMWSLILNWRPVFSIISLDKTELWSTICHNKTHLHYSILMYWMIFWLLTIHKQQNILGKTITEVDSSHIHASFGTFCGQIGQSFESQWDLKLS